MNYSIRKKRFIAIALAIFFSGLGVIVADATSENEIVVKGTLGLMILLLFMLTEIDLQ